MRSSFRVSIARPCERRMRYTPMRGCSPVVPAVPPRLCLPAVRRPDTRSARPSRRRCVDGKARRSLSGEGEHDGGRGIEGIRVVSFDAERARTGVCQSVPNAGQCSPAAAVHPHVGNGPVHVEDQGVSRIDAGGTRGKPEILARCIDETRIDQNVEIPVAGCAAGVHGGEDADPFRAVSNWIGWCRSSCMRCPRDRRCPRRSRRRWCSL